MLGQTDSGKTFTLHGPKGRDFSNGLLPFTAQSLFETLEKRVSLNGYRYSGQDKLGIQIFEVYAELAKDLIEPSNDGLTVTLDDNEEPIVNGLTTRWFSNAYELNQIIQTSRANRVGDNSDSGDKSAVLYVFKMTRNEVSDNQAVKGGLVQSRMTIVDSCGAELFLKDPKKLVLREGIV